MKRLDQLTQLTAAQLAQDDIIGIRDTSAGQTKYITVKDLTGSPDTGWTATGEAWSFSSWNSATNIGVVTVPTNATTKYAVGMFVRIAQTTGGTKWGKILAVTATTLSVWMPGQTLNNEAINTPVYSTVAHPVGIPVVVADGNPYAFSAYRSAALNSPAAFSALVPYDAEFFDTTGNHDAVTNKGRFTAAVPGDYFFTANINLGSSVSSVAILLLYKNGAQVGRGLDIRVNSSNKGIVVSALLRLAAGDYVEIYEYTDAAYNHDVTGVSNNMFEGFMIGAR